MPQQSKCQSPTTVSLKTTLTQTITPVKQLILLGSTIQQQKYFLLEEMKNMFPYFDFRIVNNFNI